jgi:hypothetical protein
MKFRKLTPAGVVLGGVALVASLALVPAAFAGKPGSGGGGTTGGSGGTISLVMVKDANGDGLPNVLDKITFAVSTSATDKPWVTVDCTQGGTLVYHAANGIFPTSLNQVFTLGSNSWTSGAASCTAYLQNWTSTSKRGGVTNLASMSFNVGA